MKADILNLRYCEKCIDKKVMWVLYKWYPYVLKKNMECIPQYGISELLKFLKETK